MNYYSQEKNNREALYIPAGVKNRKEYFSGFGKEELLSTVKAAVFVIIAALAAVILTGVYLNAFLVLLAGMTVVVIMLTKNAINISAVDSMRFVYEFYNSRQSYPYVYKNEFTAGTDGSCEKQGSVK